MERFVNYFEPSKYVLDILIDKKAKTIGGVVTVTGLVKNEVVKFHAVRLEITDVLVNGEKASFRRSLRVTMREKRFRALMSQRLRRSLMLKLIHQIKKI